uniref:Uncharacterized protein n=1 Tax=Cucumis sativus TaxID=3659 RepID=A0A0A0L728_CUCSA
MRNHEEPQPHEQFDIMELILQLSPYHNKPHHQDTEFHDDHKDKRVEDDDGDVNTDDQYDNRNEKEDKVSDEDEMKEWDEKEGEDDEYDEAEGWDEEEEDEELEMRIEEFIAKVNKRWREEKLRDHLLIQICSTNNVTNISN